MKENKIPEIYDNVLELIDLFCEEGKKYYTNNSDEKAVLYYEHALTISKYFARIDGLDDVFNPIVAKCMYYYGEALQNERIIYKAVILAIKYHQTNRFCKFIVDVGKRTFGIKDEDIKLLQ